MYTPDNARYIKARKASAKRQARKARAKAWRKLIRAIFG
jgi:hypothetical protein